MITGGPTPPRPSHTGLRAGLSGDSHASDNCEVAAESLSSSPELTRSPADGMELADRFGGGGEDTLPRTRFAVPGAESDECLLNVNVMTCNHKQPADKGQEDGV